MPAAPSADTSLVGMVLAGKYRVVRQIGRGGMGVVYEAEHIALAKRVAIKLMLEKYAGDTEAIARFHREALAASRIGNPHIIDVSDIGTAPDGRSFVVMELLTGTPLSHLIERTGPLPLARAVRIMRQVLRAVGAAHAKGIVHRDLKPDNIFIVDRGDQHDFVKLLDFGISKVLDLDEQIAFTKLTTTGVVMGTPLYMAPEQAMGHPTERHADLYACGVIFYEMLAGRPPFEGTTYAALIAKLLTVEPPFLGDARPGLPGQLVRAVHLALEKEPTKRVQSAEQFASMLPAEGAPSSLELASTLDSGSGSAVTPPTLKRRAKRWPVRAAGGVLLVAAAVGMFLVVGQTTTDPPSPSAAAPAPAPAPARAPAGELPAEKPATIATPGGPEQTAAASGILQIKSVPPGATVSVDGRVVGVTPIEITLEARRYQVQAALAGFDAIASDEDVRANERSSVVLQLQRASIDVGRKSPNRSRPATKTRPQVVPAREEPALVEPVRPPQSAGSAASRVPGRRELEPRPNPY